MKFKWRRILIFTCFLLLLTFFIFANVSLFGNYQDSNFDNNQIGAESINNHFTGNVEVWGKAAISEYFWLHIFGEEKEKVSGMLLYEGSLKIQDIFLNYKSGPYLTQSTCNVNVENLVIILNGREDTKVNKAKAWLDFLLFSGNLRRLKNLGIIILGNEACQNSWINRYLHLGILKFIFIVYDVKINSNKIFQWPLGVATYRHFPLIPKTGIDVNNKRKYKCNFLGTVYPNSSRERLKTLLDQESFNCYVKTRSFWLAKESKNSMDLYHQVLKDSDFTLCPVGINSESYRVYESMSYGSIPILEDKTTEGVCDINGPYRLLKKYEAPVIYIKDWTELKGMFNKGTFTERKIVNLRKRILDWYEIFKYKIREEFLDALSSNFQN